MFPLLCFHLLKSAGASSLFSVSRVRKFHRTSLLFWHNISNTWYTLSVTWKLCSWLQLYSLAAHAQTTAYSIFFFFNSPPFFLSPVFLSQSSCKLLIRVREVEETGFSRLQGSGNSSSVSWFGDVASPKALEATHTHTHTLTHTRTHTHTQTVP